jgi:hypothetical protein
VATPSGTGGPGRVRLSRRTGIALAGVIVAVGLVALVLQRRPSGGDEVDPLLALPTVPAGTPALGAYAAPVTDGGIDGIVRFSQAVGRRVTVATAYLDSRSDWATFSKPTWLLDPWAAWLRADPTRRLVLGVPMLQERAAGRFDDASHDGAFVGLARSIVDHGIADQVVIRLGFEMNGDWTPYGRQHDPDGSGFRDMWRRVVPKMKAVHPFVFDWCVVPTADPDDPGWAERFYPGDDVVDVVGVDAYDHWTTGTQDERWSQVVADLDWAATFAGAHGKPLALDEWGVWERGGAAQGGGDDPTYVANMLRWADEHDLLWTSYFNSPQGGVNTTLQQNPASLAAFRVAMGIDPEDPSTSDG